MVINKKQKLIFNWINDKLNLPTYANGYMGAVTQLIEKHSGYVIFVAHFCRDLMNGLARDYKGFERKQTNYRNHVDRINALWDSKWSFYDDNLKHEVKTHFEIPVNICNEINQLVINHEDATSRSNESNILFFSTFLNYEDKDSIPENFLDEWKKAKDFFMTLAHHRKKPVTDADEIEINRQFRIIDHYLLIAAESEYKRLKRLDEILQQTNP